MAGIGSKNQKRMLIIRFLLPLFFYEIKYPRKASIEKRKNTDSNYDISIDSVIVDILYVLINVCCNKGKSKKEEGFLCKNRYSNNMPTPKNGTYQKEYLRYYRDIG